MSVLLLLLFGGFLFLGMFFLAADLLKVPYMKTEKALLDTGRNNKKGSAAFDAFLLQGAMRLSHVIRMDEYRKSRMKNVLKATGIKMTPEVYQAYALTKAGLLMAGIIPCLLLFPLLTPIVVFLAVMVYFKEIQRADEMLKSKENQSKTNCHVLLPIWNRSCRITVMCFPWWRISGKMPVQNLGKSWGSLRQI